MKKSVALLLSVSSASLLSACLFQNDPGSPAATAKFEIKASAAASALVKTSATPGLTLGDSTGTQFNLTEAKVYLERIKLESENGGNAAGCDTVAPVVLKKNGDSTGGKDENEAEKEVECKDDQELSIKGPFIVDLLTGLSTPDLGALSVPAGTYTNIKIRLGHGNVGDTAALDGNTLVAKGTYTVAGMPAQPFSISIRLNEDLKIQSKQTLQLDGATVHTVLVQLMAGDWLNGLDFSRCLAAQDSTTAGGTLDVNENSEIGRCLDVEHALKRNFRKSFHADEKDEHATEDKTETGSK